MFIVPKGWKFIHADLSQAEARVVIWLSRNLDVINRFFTDPTFDIHKWKASQIYGVLESEVSKDQRQRAKACNHSGNYGISAKKFSYVSKIPLVEARPLLEKHQSDPFLQLWWCKVQDQLHKDRTLMTAQPFGRKRTFYGRLDDDVYRQAYNYEPQTLVGDILNTVCWKLDNLLDEFKAHLILQVHDEVDIEAREDYVTETLSLLKKVFHIPLIFGPDVPPLVIPVEYSVGDNWYDQEVVYPE
jgi:DNA polymerase-1